MGSATTAAARARCDDTASVLLIAGVAVNATAWAKSCREGERTQHQPIDAQRTGWPPLPPPTRRATASPNHEDHRGQHRND
jgi:hypothetical protein